MADITRYIYRCRLHQQAAFVLQEKRGNRGVEMSGQRIKKIDTSEKDFEVYTQVKDAVCMIDIEKNELIYMNEEAKNIRSIT